MILYICDKKKNCKDKDCELCGYTTDIKHAINFNKREESDFYVEQEKDIKAAVCAKTRKPQLIENLFFKMPCFIIISLSP